MARYRMLAIALLIPVAALVAVGCGGSDKQDKPKASGGTPPVKPGGDGGKGPSTTASTGDKTALEATGTGTLKGKVTFAGSPPERAPLKIPDENKDKAHCLKGDVKDPTWIVGADKGVANVV